MSVRIGEDAFADGGGLTRSKRCQSVPTSRPRRDVELLCFEVLPVVAPFVQLRAPR